MKRKFKLLLEIVEILLVSVLFGCSSPTTESSADDDNKPLWEKNENGYTEKVVRKETNEDGIKTTVLAYTLVEDSTERGVGFGVAKMESNNNTIYKGIIIVKRVTEAFEENFWNHYTISCGQTSIIMSNAIGGPAEEDGDFEYIIMGGLSELQLEALKNASVLTITIYNTDYPERQTSFICNSSFIKNLIKYF